MTQRLLRREYTLSLDRFLSDLRSNIYWILDCGMLALLRHFGRLVVQGVSIALVGCLALVFALAIQIGACALFSDAREIEFIANDAADIPDMVVLQAHPPMQVAPWDQSLEENRRLLDGIMHPPLNSAVPH